jgi:transcriptional antiterminator NusG
MTEYKIGDTVRIKTGPLASFVGKVDEVFYETATLKVRVDIWSRSTPVSLTFSDVQKVAPARRQTLSARQTTEGRQLL